MELKCESKSDLANSSEKVFFFLQSSEIHIVVSSSQL